jgi:hypothetical protein
VIEALIEAFRSADIDVVGDREGRVAVCLEQLPDRLDLVGDPVQGDLQLLGFDHSHHGLVLKGVERREDRRGGRGGPGRRGVHAMEDDALRRQLRQEGSGVLRVPVEGQVIGPQRVDHDQDDVDVPGLAARLPGMAGREEHRQEAQHRDLECHPRCAPHADSLRDRAGFIKVLRSCCAL